MRKLAMRLSVLAIGTTALATAPVIAPAHAEGSPSHMHHMKKHHRHWRHQTGGAWYGYPAQPMAGSYGQSDWVCPGIGRSFECKVWPPPFEDDPDRETSKY